MQTFVFSILIMQQFMHRHSFYYSKFNVGKSNLQCDEEILELQRDFESILMAQEENSFQPLQEKLDQNQIELQQVQKKTIAIRTQKDRTFVPQSDSEEVWHRGCLSILAQLKQAGTMFLMMSEKLRFRNLKKRDFELIGDTASDYDTLFFENYFTQRPNFFLILLYNFTKFLNKLKCGKQGKQTPQGKQVAKFNLLKPDSKFIDFWNLIILLFLLMNFFYQSFQIVFTEQFQSDHFQIDWLFQVFPIFLYILDICRKFKTSFYHNGQLVSEQFLIITRYLSTQLFLDILTIISLCADILPDIYYDLIKLIAILKFFKINRILKQLKENNSMHSYADAIFTLSHLLLKIILTAHICGISFIYITKFESENITWMHKSNLIGTSWKQQYVTSIYWAIVTMITLGYGDIVPITTEERIFVIFVSFLACGIFAYTFNSIGTIFSNMNEQSNKMRQKIANITMYLSQRRVSRATQMKISKYVAYIYEKQLESEMMCQETLDQLTIDLKSELAIEMYGKLLNDAKPFKLNFGKRILNNLALHMKQCHFPGDTCIIQSGELNRKFYFVIDGQLQQMFKFRNDMSGIKLQKLTSGSFFGKDSFFSGMAENFSIKSIGIVNLAYLEFDDFLSTLKLFPTEFQRFCQKRDQFLLNGNEGFELICSICNGFRHTPDSCPLLSFKKPKDKIIYSLLHQDLDITQDRKVEFIRQRQRFKQKPYHIEELHMDAIDILQDLNYYPDQYLLHEQQELIQMSLDRVPEEEAKIQIGIEDPIQNQQQIQEDEQQSDLPVIQRRTSYLFFEAISAQKLVPKNTPDQQMKADNYQQIKNSNVFDQKPQVTQNQLKEVINESDISSNSNESSSSSSSSSQSSQSSLQSSMQSFRSSDSQNSKQNDPFENSNSEVQKNQTNRQLNGKYSNQQGDAKKQTIQKQGVGEPSEIIQKREQQSPKQDQIVSLQHINHNISDHSLPSSQNLSNMQDTHNQVNIDRQNVAGDVLKIHSVDQIKPSHPQFKQSGPEINKSNHQPDTGDLNSHQNNHQTFKLGDQFLVKNNFDDCDKMCEYQNYFKWFNISLVLQQQTNKTNTREQQLKKNRTTQKIFKMPQKVINEMIDKLTLKH